MAARRVLPLSIEDLMVDLNRRRPGQSHLVTQRQESDAPEILAGVFERAYYRTSLAILIRNEDSAQPGLHRHQGQVSPGHADYTYGRQVRLSVDYRGGGAPSARETGGARGSGRLWPKG